MALQKKKGWISENILLLSVLTIGVILSVAVVMQRTTWLERAAGPNLGQLATNLNSSSEITSTINPDGTMGPTSWYGNWSNTLLESEKGKLNFGVTDPPPTDKPANPNSKGKRPEQRITPEEPLPTNDIEEASSPAEQNGPREAAALNLTITKVEVHLASLESRKGSKGEPSVSPSAKPEKIDHWETLNTTTPFTVDLMELARTQDFSMLGLTSLAAGRYTEVRLYVGAATATLSDGTTVVLEIPGHNNIVRVVRPFVVTAGGQTKLVMDFNAKRSIVKAGNKYILKPVVSRLIQEHQKPQITP